METLRQFVLFSWLALSLLVIGCVALGSLLSPEPPNLPDPTPGPEGNQPPADPNTSRE